MARNIAASDIAFPTADFAAAGIYSTSAKATDAALSTRLERVRRILNSAQRGMSPIGGVIANPVVQKAQGTDPTTVTGPVYIQTAASAASTVNTSATSPGSATGSILITDKRVSLIGGVSTIVVAGLKRRILGVTLPNAVYSGHGSGISFAFYGQVFDFSADFVGNGWTMYVTDPTTGVRSRAAAADFTDTSGFTFHRVDFGSAAFRFIEIYAGAATGGTSAAQFGAINIPSAGAAIWRWVKPFELNLGIMWDSWGAGALSGGTNPVKLAVTDYFGATLGVSNPLSLGSGGTGFLATAGATANTYRTRLSAGDFDIAKVGKLDSFGFFGSLNDFNLSGNTAAAQRAEMLTTLQQARTIQPDANIFVVGPQITPSSAITQDFFDAHAGAFADFADPNSVYLDNSPSGEAWNNAVINAVNFTGNGNHVNDVGKVNYGVLAANSYVNALKQKFGF
jgi:hypothetical protein